MKRAALLALTALLVSAWTLPAPASAAELTEAEKLEFALNVALPSPSEMFLALNKLGGVDWDEVARVNERYDYADNYSRALNLGLRAGDGLLAILAQSRDKLGRSITAITTLAEELMVQESILDRAGSFQDMAEAGQWETLRGELESLRYQIEMEMDSMGDADIATLVQAGGWLAAMRSTAQVFMTQAYGDQTSSIFYQPALVDYFAEQLLLMAPTARNNPAVREIMLALPEMRMLVDAGYEKPVSRASIEKLFEISSRLINLIEEEG